MEPIDTSKIRGFFQEYTSRVDSTFSLGQGAMEYVAGADPNNSIKLVADKVNEIVQYLNDEKAARIIAQYPEISL